MYNLFSCFNASSSPSTFFLYGLMLAVGGSIAVTLLQGHRFMLHGSLRRPGVVTTAVIVLAWISACAASAGILARAAASGYIQMVLCVPASRLAPILFIAPVLLALVYLGLYHCVRLPALRAKETELRRQEDSLAMLANAIERCSRG